MLDKHLIVKKHLLIRFLRLRFILYFISDFPSLPWNERDREVSLQRREFPFFISFFFLFISAPSTSVFPILFPLIRVYFFFFSPIKPPLSAISRPGDPRARINSIRPDTVALVFRRHVYTLARVCTRIRVCICMQTDEWQGYKRRRADDDFTPRGYPESRCDLAWVPIEFFFFHLFYFAVLIRLFVSSCVNGAKRIIDFTAFQRIKYCCCVNTYY